MTKIAFDLTKLWDEIIESGGQVRIQVCIPPRAMHLYLHFRVSFPHRGDPYRGFHGERGDERMIRRRHGREKGATWTEAGWKKPGRLRVARDTSDGYRSIRGEFPGRLERVRECALALGEIGIGLRNILTPSANQVTA